LGLCRIYPRSGEENRLDLEKLREENDVENEVVLKINDSTQSRNRCRLPEIKFGESYTCGCGICEKQYVNSGQIVKCAGCSNIYVNKYCNVSWKCFSCHV
jgi:hypothetical protein